MATLFSVPASPQTEETTRTLFHERSITPRSNSSLSSRRPSFSASNASSSSSTFVDRTISTQRILNSPFYNGRTIYGGASAYGRKLGRSSSELRSNLNSSVQVKPKNEGNNESMVLSKTARRILDTLEQYTTPVNDAKKIPVVPRKNVKQEGLFAKYAGANPYRREIKVASNTELHVPTVPELLKMKQQLQESTEAVRQIATTSNSNLNKEEYKLPAVEEDSSKRSSKIKSKVCAVRQKANPEADTVEQVKLPSVSLPISTLPKFDFSVPPLTPFPKSPVSAQPKEPIQNKTETKLVPKERTNSTTEFKFSDPLVIADNIESIIGANNFKFSEPILKKHLTSNFKVSDTSEFKPKRVQKNNGEIQTAPQLVTGSVMDVLGKKSSLMYNFKPAEGTWECSVCMVRNQPNVTKCIACESPKVAPPPKSQTNDGCSNPSSNLLDKFKPQEGTWECEACLVRNKPDAVKCVACETLKAAPSQKDQATHAFAKPDTSLLDKFKPQEGTWECSICMVRNKADASKCVACESPKVVPPPKQQTENTFSRPFARSDLMDKFKPPEGTWECPVCMIRNKSEATRCAACESPRTTPPPKSQIKSQDSPNHSIIGSLFSNKPSMCTEKDSTTNSGFGEQFKPAKDTWECSSCMVRNKAVAEKCVACESLKPELKHKLNVGFGDQFKKKESEWECSSCMVKNSSDKTKCVCCEAAKPGMNLDDKKSGFTKFSFGVDKQATSKFTFGFKTANNVPLQQQSSSSASFVFGGTSAVTASAIQSPLSGGKTTESEAPTQTQPMFGIAPVKKPVSNDAAQETEKPPVKANSFASTADNSKPATFTGTALPSLPVQNNASDVAKTANTTKPVFKFGTSVASTSSDTKSPFSNTSLVSSATPFAAPSTQTTGVVKPFSFGTSKSDEEPPAKVPNFSFGQKTDAPKVEVTSTVASQPSGAVFNFGGADKATSFSLNAAASTPAASVPQPSQNGFSFGSGMNNSGSFSFGKPAATAAAPPTAGVFNFGSTSSQVR